MKVNYYRELHLDNRILAQTNICRDIGRDISYRDGLSIIFSQKTLNISRLFFVLDFHIIGLTRASISESSFCEICFLANINDSIKYKITICRCSTIDSRLTGVE